MDKQPLSDTDNLSMYDLPSLNAVISKYEQQQWEDEIKPDLEAQNNTHNINNVKTSPKPETTKDNLQYGDK